MRVSTVLCGASFRTVEVAKYGGGLTSVQWRLFGRANIITVEG